MSKKRPTASSALLAIKNNRIMMKDTIIKFSSIGNRQIDKQATLFNHSFVQRLSFDQIVQQYLFHGST